MLSFLETVQKYVNKRKYYLLHNGEKINISTRRIKGFRDYVRSVAKSPEFKEGKSYFFYNEYNFASFGMSEPIDIVFVDWDGKIVHTEESFPMNKISEKQDKIKYIYIFPINTIKKHKMLSNNTLTHVYERKKGGIKMGDFI